MEILALTGHILLIVLFVVIAIVACALFVPSFYRVKVVKAEEESVLVNGYLHFILALVTVKLAYTKDGFGWHVYVLGIPVSDLILRAREKRRQREINKVSAQFERPVRARKQPTIKPAKKTFTTDADREQPDFQEEKPTLFQRIALTIRGIYDKIIALRHGLEVFKLAWPYLFRLLKHLRPRKIQGEMEFGFEDPSSTGRLLGLISVVYPVIPAKLEIIPDFQEKRFGCDISARGHFIILYVIINIVKLMKIPEVKALLAGLNGRRRKNNG